MDKTPGPEEFVIKCIITTTKVPILTHVSFKWVKGERININ
jgi:hypothetical protein